ncbi:MAG: hypothetical protein AB1424_01145 [Thermodesulfobacteriota bacterium]
MADTVKTQVMKALETTLKAGVPEVKTVERREPVGTDLDKINLPALFLYEEEESGSRHNRLRLGVIRVEMAVFIRLKPGKDHGFQAFYDLADTIAGRVYMAIQTSPSLSGLVIQAEEDPRRKAIGNESFGELVLKYRLTYGHAVNDAFTTQVV